MIIRPLLKVLYVPYSVASGKQNTDGHADFIQKNSNSQITILAGGSNPNLVICYPDGVTEQVSVDTVMSSGLTADNKYFMVKEKGSSIVVTTKNITEDIKQPQSPNTGDYWLNIGIRPYKPFKYDGLIWVETQFVKLGEVIKTSGTLGIPVSYAFNGYYKTTVLGTISSQFNLLNHNLGTSAFTISKTQYQDNQNNRLLEFGLSPFYDTEARGIFFTDSSQTTVYFDKNTNDGYVLFYRRNNAGVTSNSGSFNIELKRSF